MVQIARPGGVSVFMLAESWHANTVMHILAIHGFNTQLLLLYEQVVGRALRKRSFDQNEERRSTSKYADILGIPFEFTAYPVMVAPAPPPETVRVQAMKDRAALRITFPRIEGTARSCRATGSKPPVPPTRCWS